MNIVYRISSTIMRHLFSVIYRTTWYGLENIPKDGPLIVACNHVSFFDPPLIGCSAHRDFSYLARETLMSNPISAWLLPRLNVVGVDREGGKDAKAVRYVLKSLKAGKAVVIFPEGTRSNDGMLQSAKAGIGLIACRSGVPVLPVRVFGAFNAFSRHHKLPSLRGRIKVVYGRPIQPNDFDPGKKATNRYQIAIDRVMEAIASQKIPVDLEV